MNRRNLQRLIETLPTGVAEGITFRFNMMTFLDADREMDCVACMGGVAALMTNAELRDSVHQGYFRQQKRRLSHMGMEFLDITEEQAYALFCPGFKQVGTIWLSDIDLTWAMSTLHKLMSTGEVSWER